ncbi:hypothetical protein FRB94_001259 [Tulasnella sp. JGI-2019a]|nr:hypothetical protein FRB94_001259 [Tulasnella sp. JGI-2019a]
MIYTDPTSWFDLLPTETIILIFTLASRCTEVRSLQSNDAFPSAALRVSRQWRNIAQATPSIWTNPIITAYESAGQRLKEHLQYCPPNQPTHLDILVPPLSGMTHDEHMVDNLFDAIRFSQNTQCLRSIRLVASEGASTVSIVYIHEAFSRAWGRTLEGLEMVGCDVLTEPGQTTKEILPFKSGLEWYSQIRFLSLENISTGGLGMSKIRARRYCLTDLEELYLKKVNSTALIFTCYYSMPKLRILAIDCSSGSSTTSTIQLYNGGSAVYRTQYIHARYIILYNIPSGIDIRKILEQALRAQYLALTFDDSHDFEVNILPTLMALSSRQLHSLSFRSRYPSLKLIKRIVESRLPRLLTIELDGSAILDADNEDLRWLRANARLELRSEGELEFSQVLGRLTGRRPQGA